ncbi:uncharacterized protein LOC132302948 [Cornus florida]|uniref:uncharacterized protein LOC132302948 n=1 Tax=Cornus florida TaxID=4283 RepID=UPI0028A29CC0|nr:uncharacterized protein LOC132302948 [Cornus florida]
MQLKHSSITLLITLIPLIFLPSISSQSCQTTCGKQLIRYPFGTGLGCGSPRFQNYVTCNQHQLTFTTHTGCYPITSIDYINQVIYISDATMSTCTCTQPSKGFGLDWDAPFSLHDDNIFALLDCSTDSSPLYKSSGGSNATAAAVPLCDTEDAPICSLLYSCQPVSRIDIPVSTCCVYTPVDLGPAFEIDLQKLQCASYSGFYSFNGRESDPANWAYGVALKYKFNVNNDYPALCVNCERSRGACGYSDPYDSFVCYCPTYGMNTSTDCFYAASLSNGSGLFPWQTGSWLIYSLACFLIVWLSS